VRLEGAVKIALSSMVSTAHANLSVGPPYDLGVYLNGSLELVETRVEANSPYLASLTKVWMTHFLDAIGQLPPLPTTG
jgi:putative proteasome-type protease